MGKNRRKATKSAPTEPPVDPSWIHSNPTVNDYWAYAKKNLRELSDSGELTRIAEYTRING